MAFIIYLFLLPRIEAEPPNIFPYRGIYLNAYMATKIEKYLNYIRDTEINCIVVDFKDGHGYITYNSELGFPKKIGAILPIINLEKLINRCKKEGVQLVARVVLFQDSIFAFYNKGLYAITDNNNKIWRDEKGNYWVDPSFDAVQVYNIEIAKELAQRGIEEIQFDYIRFPSLSENDKPYKIKCWDKEKVIQKFLENAKEELKQFDVKISADVFGYAIWWDRLEQEGQNLEIIAPLVDIIHPMLYPSHFGYQFERTGKAWERDYNIVLKSIAKGKERIGEIKFIPYIQGFEIMAYNFGPEYIDNQIKAVKDSDASGYVIWNAKGDYTPLWQLLEMKNKQMTSAQGVYSRQKK